MAVADPRKIRMLDCCGKVLVPVLWHHDERRFTMACPECGVLQNRAGKARVMPKTDATFARLARQQGLID